MNDRSDGDLMAYRGFPVEPDSEHTYLVPRSYPGPGVPDDGGFDPKRLWSLLWRRRVPVVLGGASAFGLVALLTFLTPKTYESTATFLIEEAESGSNSPAFAVLERLGRGRTIETEIQLLSSRRVVAPVVERLDLHVAVAHDDEERRAADAFPLLRAGREVEPGSYVLSFDPESGWSILDEASGKVLATGDPGQQVSVAGVEFAFPPAPQAGGGNDESDLGLVVSSFEGTVGAARGRIRAETVGRDADLIRLTCSGGEPEPTQAFCSAVVQSYLQLRVGLQHQEATAAAAFLEEQVAGVDRRLAAAEDSLQSYQEREQAVALDARAEESVRNYVGLRAQREQLRAENAALQSLIAAIRSGEGGTDEFRNVASFPTFLRTENQIVSRLIASLVNLEDQRAELLLRRSEANPDVQALDRRIAEIEREILGVATSYQRALSAEVTSLGQTLASARQQLSSIPERQVESARLERQVLLLEDLFRFLQTRLREAEIAQAVNLPNVQVIDPASLPRIPVAPRTRRNLALGLVLGGGFGLLLGILFEYGDTRVRGRGEVESRTGYPVLAMIPRLAVARAPARLPAGKEAASLVPVAKLSEDRDVALEAFRSLAVELAFLGNGGNGGSQQSVAVTSPGAGDGKTFTACNLAIAETTLGRRTLVIDADLRARGTSRFFSIPQDAPGLAEILSEGISVEQIMEHLRYVDVGGEYPLAILPCGADMAASGEILKSAGVGALLRSLRDHFERLVVDTPPLNVLADAATVSSQVDSVLVVVREGGTQAQGLALTLERLGRARAPVAGIVMNDVELPSYYKSYSRAEY